MVEFLSQFISSFTMVLYKKHEFVSVCNVMLCNIAANLLRTQGNNRLVHIISHKVLLNNFRQCLMNYGFVKG